MKRSIRTKIIMTTVFVICTSLLTGSWFTFSYVTAIVREQAVKDNRTKLAQISSSLSRMQDRLQRTSETIIVAPEINKPMVKRPGASLEEEYFNKVAVMKQLQRLAALDSTLLNIMIIRPDGEVFSNYSGYEDYFAGYIRESWMQPFLGRSNATHFSSPHDFRFISGNQRVISYVTRYRNMQDGDARSQYLLVLDMKLAEIGNVFKDSSADFSQIRLLSGDGEAIYDSRPGDLEQENDDYIALSYTEMNEGWRQEALLSKSKLYENIRPILVFYLFIVIGSLLFVLIVIPPVILRFTGPITLLARAMRRVSAGELHTTVQIRSGDEMEELGRGFNKMVGDLDSWMKSALREQELKRNMQINLLLSEINPHFIYNTLNTVIYLSHAGRSGDTITITRALIDILQDTIRPEDGAYFSTLQGELDIVTKYATIQQYRYPDKFRLEWDIPSGLLRARALRMMLQPLVENALLHGIFACEHEGVIRIGATLRDGTLEVAVTDNGAGIDANYEKGIGLSNISERIQFHYGSGYGIEVEGEKGRGTAVTIRIPFEPEVGNGS